MFSLSLCASVECVDDSWLLSTESRLIRVAGGQTEGESSGDASERLVILNGRVVGYAEDDEADEDE